MPLALITLMEHPRRIERRLRGYESLVLPLNYGCIWYAIRDSNPELTGYKPGTLTVELMAHKLAVSSFIPFRIITDHLATPYDI